MIRRPPRSTKSRSSAASDVYKRQVHLVLVKQVGHFPCKLHASELAVMLFLGIIGCYVREAGYERFTAQELIEGRPHVGRITLFPVEAGVDLFQQLVLFQKTEIGKYSVPAGQLCR